MQTIRIFVLVMMPLCGFVVLVAGEGEKHDGRARHKKQPITGTIQQIYPNDDWRRMIHFRQDRAQFEVVDAHTVWCNERVLETWPVESKKVEWCAEPDRIVKFTQDSLVSIMTPLQIQDHSSLKIRAKVYARAHSKICDWCETNGDGKIPDDETKVLKWEEYDNPNTGKTESDDAKRLHLFQMIVQVDNRKEFKQFFESDNSDGAMTYNQIIGRSGLCYLQTPNVTRAKVYSWSPMRYYYQGPPYKDTTEVQPKTQDNACIWAVFAGYKDAENSAGGVLVNGVADMQGSLTLAPDSKANARFARNIIWMRCVKAVDLSGLISFGVAFAAITADVALTGGTSGIAWKILVKATVGAVAGGIKTAVCSHPDQPSATAIFHGHVQITPDHDGISSGAERDKVCEVQSLTNSGFYEGQWNADGIRIRGFWPLNAWKPVWGTNVFKESFANMVNLRVSSLNQRVITGRGAIEGAILANPARGLIWVSLQLRPYALQQVLTSAAFTTLRTGVPSLP